MKKLVFDIETNMLDIDTEGYDKLSFVDRVKDVACLCVIDLDSKQRYSFHDNPDLKGDGTLLEGMDMLLSADILIGHFIGGFDVPAIQKVYPELAEAFGKMKLFDTLEASRQLFSWPQLAKYDNQKKVKHSPKNAKGLHSLGAWGDRFVTRLGLDLAKDEEYARNVNWSNIEINQDLIDYCMQDVIVNIQVYITEMREHKRKKEKDSGS